MAVDAPEATLYEVGVLAVVLAMLGLSAAALALAPAFIPGDYSWVSNTTSESAAQGVDGAWVARAGFVLFGVAVLGLAAARRRVWGRLVTALHAAVGAFMVGTAAFSTRPWTATAPYDRTEDLLHSVAATGAPLAFVLAVVVAAWARARRTGGSGFRLIDGVALAGSLLVLLSMSAWPEADGLVQRGMFAILYCWYGMESVAVRSGPGADRERIVPT